VKVILRYINSSSLNSDLPNLIAKVVAEAAYKGDEVAIDIYKTSSEFLGRGLAILIEILNPEIIILGSIYGRAKSLIEPYMRKMITAEAIGDSYKACHIVPPGLSENIGDMAALALARESILNSVAQL
jgi:glucokinase